MLLCFSQRASFQQQQAVHQVRMYVCIIVALPFVPFCVNPRSSVPALSSALGAWFLCALEWPPPTVVLLFFTVSYARSFFRAPVKRCEGWLDPPPPLPPRVCGLCFPVGGRGAPCIASFHLVYRTDLFLPQTANLPAVPAAAVVVARFVLLQNVQ